MLTQLRASDYDSFLVAINRDRIELARGEKMARPLRLQTRRSPVFARHATTTPEYC